MKVKVDIISGFLGAGKTTLIKKLLEEKLNTEKLVIIENEFGEIGIDGTLLKKSGIEIKEINSGCICCSLVGDFEKSISEVIEKFKPERIIIEPSGVGKLSEVIKACSSKNLEKLLEPNMTITVVDVNKYDMYITNFSEFYKNQIKNAKTVVLSRTQKVQLEKIEDAVASIRKINKEANIVTTPWDEIKADNIIAVAEKDMSISLEKKLIEPKKIVLKKHVHGKSCNCNSSKNHSHNEGCGCGDNHSANEVFEVWGIETPRRFEKIQLDNILEDLKNEKIYGIILRGKGIIQSLKDKKWIEFDFVPGEYQFRDSDADYTGRVCFIGKNLNKIELEKLFGIN
ncbi:GTP-binding protein [Herbivorax sp. ANBcel31]|uniref:CobW family GTP-binding protein n=1 Tax=Herbivorax sp. ANBcel31 TaxID=3069754 RepID=UPI0027B3041B|nr:GTP-binding protein [Herbivorax sp. ANBcel31]MDQ2087635.1 GTP-binding protein [Herbivorax sp. ANBcel31]